MSKEWEVAEAYYNDKPIVLQDPDDERSRNKQWHDCGDKPATPVNGRDVVCGGKWCAAVCNQGKTVRTLKLSDTIRDGRARTQFRAWFRLGTSESKLG